MFELAKASGRCLVAGCRQRGRKRQTLVEPFPNPVVCDLCWGTNGGPEGLAAVVAGEQDVRFAPRPAPDGVRLVDPEVGLAWDDLHPVDQFLIGCGVRWDRLRWMPRPMRAELATQVAAREAPAGTQAVISGEQWLQDAVGPRIATSAHFRQDRSRQTCWNIAIAFAGVLQGAGRPLVYLKQDYAGAAVDRCTKTIQRYVGGWLTQEKLLWELVPGIKVDALVLPEAPTAAELAVVKERAREREEAAVATENAAILRARAEIELLNQGVGRERAARLARRRHPVPQRPVRPKRQVTVSPVYELRMPIPEEVLAERAEMARAQFEQAPGRALLEANRERWVDPRNVMECLPGATAVGADGTLAWVTADELLHADRTGALTSTNVVGWLRGEQNVHPVVDVSIEDHLLVVRGVDNRPPSAGSWTDMFAKPAEMAYAARNPVRTTPKPLQRPSKARRAAQAVKEHLDPSLAEVPVRTLEALIAPWIPTWSVSSIVRRIHGNGLPELIHSPARFIAHKLKSIPPGLSPDQRKALDDKLAQLATVNAEASQHRVDVLARVRRERIAECALCDEAGWLHVSQEVAWRCSHDPDTSGW
ncbi:hypothetical protein L3Q67_45180 (plasmid) [Saccharothrix sp. AJ9571]|nr:hypothetical protein L3Q67_45180 [Saccharothrix sp. AJ9571]